MQADKEYVVKSGMYRIRCVQLSEEPEQWYWHLYRHDIRVNGGLNDSLEEAMFAGGVGYRKDCGEWVSRHGERV
jgi:hypothetical protein